MTVRQRLASLERAANRSGNETIVTPLSDVKKLVKMEMYLDRHGEHGAVAYAKKLHQETEVRLKHERPTPPWVEAEMRRRLSRGDSRTPEQQERDRRASEAREARAREILATTAV